MRLPRLVTGSRGAPASHGQDALVMSAGGTARLTLSRLALFRTAPASPGLSVHVIASSRDSLPGPTWLLVTLPETSVTIQDCIFRSDINTSVICKGQGVTLNVERCTFCQGDGGILSDESKVLISLSSII